MVLLSAATARIITGSWNLTLYPNREQVMFFCPRLWGATEFESSVEGREGTLGPDRPMWNPTTTN